MTSTKGSQNGSQEACSTIALKPCDLESVPNHIKKIDDLGARFSGGELRTRLHLLESARDLVRALETPRETMIKHCWAQPTAYMAINLGIKIGIFEVLSQDNGSPKNVANLASKVAVDPILLARLLRHLAAMGHITETGPDEYKPSNFSRSLNSPDIAAGYPLVNEYSGPSLVKFPEYLEKTGYRNPTDGKNGAFQYAHKTTGHIFDHYKANPLTNERFNLHMAAYHQGRDSWMDVDFFPVQERLIDGADSHDDAVFLVDIGGSLGQDIEEFHQKHPKVPGRLILQDLPGVIGQIQDLDKEIERMDYDFYTEQPIKGSRAYYMHSVLHDWPIEKCLEILARVTEAMKPGYSKLLINENVIPATGADWQATSVDLIMMTSFSSGERTEQNWRALLKDAGLKVCNIWCTEYGEESLIECELA